jgi:hypothetical protein
MFFPFHELSVSSVLVSLVCVAVVASGFSVFASSAAGFSYGVSAAGSTFWASTSVLTRSDGLPPGLYIETLSLECTLIPKLT